ncbi:MAG: ROK family transcriptional regulator [Alphaproteobacteria bacterium]|nr:ROK family transcriptional regulator [Alphaproteobacteria bacterium]
MIRQQLKEFRSLQPANVDVIRSPRHGSGQADLRGYNERLILSVLRNYGPNAKAEIARITGLSAQSASVIMRKLEAEELIERCPPVRGKVGQPSVPMKLSPDGALFFGLKVGRRSADLVLVDFLGRTVDRRHLTYSYPDPDTALDFLRRAIDELTALLDQRQIKNIAGLGIALPGYLWEWSKIVRVPAERMAAWRDRDILLEIDALFDFPVYLQNDASCACGAELVFGDQDHPANFLYFYIGYFIGGGVVIDNALFTGSTGNSGALGPLPVPRKSGGVQQLIDVASLSCLEDMIIEAGGNSNDLWETSSSWRVDDAILRKWVDQTAGGLACAIVASCSIIDFEMVVIDGWLPEDVRRQLVERTKAKLAKLNLAGLVQPEIREGTIGPDARAMGAASLPLSQHFMVSPRGL